MKEDYVSFEIAKLLKEKGFKEWCFHCYGVAVLHNGVAISFDEECELKDEGRKNEIEYVEGRVLYDCGCNNSDKDAKVWAAPTLWDTMKWLREVHNIHITIDCDICDSFDFYSIIRIKSEESWKTYVEYEDEGSNTCEEAAEKAVEYCLEHLI
jgi:hypothetical protein